MPHMHHAGLGSSWSVCFTLTLVFTAMVYLRGWLSLRSSRVKRISTGQAVSFLAGLFLIWVAVASPLAALDHELLTVHMVQHLLLMTLAPPLIWLGAPIAPLLTGLSQRFVESRLVPLWHSRTVKGFTRILESRRFTLFAASATLIGWHLPPLFALGMKSPGWHLFEQLSFLATGLLFWWPVVQPSPNAPRQDLSMILYLFFATLPCDILSGFLVFSDRVAYPIYFSSSHLWGLSPLLDQECAAALMWTCVTIVYFVAGAILTMRLLSPQGPPHVGLVQPRLRSTEIGHQVTEGFEIV